MAEIANQTNNTSAIFYIGTGQQVTLLARGLSGADEVHIEVVEIEQAIQSFGDPCCPIINKALRVVGTQLLTCPNGAPQRLTAYKPHCVIDTPQNIPLRVKIVADPTAFVSVDMVESNSPSCTDCNCADLTVCVDTTWTATGDFRCKAGNVEIQEESNCGHTRWTVSGPQVWAPSGETRCHLGFIENAEVNDCGDTRWTPTTTGCGFCASYPLLGGGYGYVDGDHKDPAATVQLGSCIAGEVQTVYLYPASGEGHTAEQRDCDGVIIGYGMNKSDCAIDLNNGAGGCGSC